MSDTKLSPRTLALNAGLSPDLITGAISPNISMSVNNVLAPGDGAFSSDGVEDLTTLPFLYARWTNPTVRQLEERLAALENTEDALATATGIAAIAAVFFTVLKQGDHLILSDVCYAGANELARRILPDFGIEVSLANTSNLDEVRAAMRPNTRLIHCESPCNPLLRLTDLKAISELAHAHGVLVSVDSTNATPVALRPCDLGVDLVIHSLTKFMNGHGDALGGVVCGPNALISKIRGRAGVYLGASMSATNAWLIMRGLDTLFPRIEMMSNTAHKLAQFLDSHSKVDAVMYPGLESHPQYSLAQDQLECAGAILTFRVRDNARFAELLSQNLHVAHYAFSLGHQRTLVVHLDTNEMMRSTYGLEGAQLEDYKRYAAGGVFRISVGLEAFEDLRADFERVLEKI